MNCREAQARLHIRVNKAQAIAGDKTLADHIQKCDLCHSYYTDLLLGQELQQMQVPAPRPGFVDKALRNAIERANRAPRRVAMPLSAAALFLIAVTTAIVMEPWKQSITPAGTVNSEIVMTANQEKTVRIMIEAAAARKNATLTIDLAENLELKGYPKRQRLEWQTDMEKGKNLLALPLILKEQSDGYVNIGYVYDHTSEMVHIVVRAGAQRANAQHSRS